MRMQYTLELFCLCSIVFAILFACCLQGRHVRRGQQWQLLFEMFWPGVMDKISCVVELVVVVVVVVVMVMVLVLDIIIRHNAKGTCLHRRCSFKR
jgi:hypothetical protein